ncbi:hypothetical protein JAB1_15140 [Janthinobacterium sp. MP5059B]|nr:hypothetical protein JAB1_15140 [Janthinobacterium sp. MP5059B]
MPSAWMDNFFCIGKSMNPDHSAEEIASFHLPVLTQQQCADVVERLLDLEPFWLRRTRHFPIHTLGATYYYDIVGMPARPYERLARQYNPFLLDNFGEVYDALLASLGAALGQPVVYHPALALPGFHMFGGHPALRASEDLDLVHEQWQGGRETTDFPGNPIHLDRGHLAVGLGAAPTLSVTLLIAAAGRGAGMKMWPFGLERTGNLDESEILALLQREPFEQIHYQTGAAFIHSGRRYHQARGFDGAPGDYRITLQGHAVWQGGQWQLFW